MHINRCIIELFSIECRKWFRVCFGFALLRSVIGLQNSRHFSTNEKQNQNKSRPACTRFPALGAGYMYLLRILIGSCALLASVVIGQSNYFGFVFMKHI